MWDIRESVDTVDGNTTRRIVVTAGARRIIIPYLRDAPFLTDDLTPMPIPFDDVLFERDALPSPDGYAVYRRVA